MALSHGLAQAGFIPKRVQTTAKVHLEKGAEGFGIPKIELVTEASVPGIDEAKFKEQADKAKKNCPVSKLLSAAEKLKPTEPAPEPVLSVTLVVSAEPSAVASPLGSEAPPDQVVETRLLLARWLSLRSTSVKLSEPVAVSAVALPVPATGPESAMPSPFCTIKATPFAVAAS